MVFPSTSHSAPMTPADTRSVPSHSAGAIRIRHQPFVPRTPASSKLRREMTQPTLNRLELYSSSSEKQLINDFSPFQMRSSNKLQQHQRSIDTRSRRSRINSTRLTADHLPHRPVTRSILIDRPPSPKGKKTPHRTTRSRPTAKQLLFFSKYLSSFIAISHKDPLTSSCGITQLPIVTVRSSRLNRFLGQKSIVLHRPDRFLPNDTPLFASSLIISTARAVSQE